MFRRFSSIATAAIGVFSIVSCVGSDAFAIDPLENAHAHNDYWHDRPLLDALDHGFTSVEADVFLVDGNLLVGHAKDELKPERTLEALYLAPLARRVQDNGGQVYHNAKRFYLLVDVKSAADETYRCLQQVLSRYDDVLNGSKGQTSQKGAVTVIVSGNRPPIHVATGSRFAAIDGRLSDLNGNISSQVMPMLSDNWTSHFKWDGEGEMPERERAKLKAIVDKAHAAGRVVRFWATPEKESIWRELREAKVDLIGTDKLEQLATFLRANNKAPNGENQ